MAVTYSAALKNTRLSAVVTALGANAKLEIGTAGMATVLATIILDVIAGTVSAGVLTFSGMPKNDTADATGTAAAARIRTSADVDVVTGLTVGLSAADVILDSLSISAGQTVTLTSASITHA